MKILVTGSSGFVGKNLTAALENIKNGKDRTRPGLHIDEVFYCDVDTSEKDLEKYCDSADFVFNLAGVNRPEKTEEFLSGNFGFAKTLLTFLEKNANSCPVMLSSSVHAAGESDYGKSKKAGEDLFLVIQTRPVLPFLSTVFRTFSANGAARTIIRLSRLSAIISRTGLK